MELYQKNIAILLENNYEEMEFWYPYYRLKEAGAEITVVAPQATEFRSKNGYPAKADLTADAADPGNFHGVIVPGGYAPDRMRLFPAMINFLKEAYNHGSLVAAICHGPWMLISAGAVKGRQVTGVPTIKDDLENAGARFVNQEVVRDGTVVTSRIPSDLPAFCREIIAGLQEN